MITGKNIRRYDEVLPYLGVENSVLVGKKGACSLLFRIDGSPVFGLDGEGYEHLNRALVQCIGSLPGHFALARYDLVYPQTAQLSYMPTEGLSVAAVHDRLHFRERPFLATESFVVLTRLPDNRPSKATWQNALFSTEGMGEPLSPSAANISELQTQAERVTSALQQALAASNKDQNWVGQHIRPLASNEVTDLVLYRFLNLSVAEPQRFVAETLNLETDMVVGSRRATILSMDEDGYPNDVYTHTLQRYGSSNLPVSMLHGLQFDLAFPHIVVNVFFPMERHKAISMLDKKSRGSIVLKSGRPGSFNDTLHKGQDKFLEEFRNDSTQHLVEHHFSVIVMGETDKPAEHGTHLNQARNLLLNKGIRFNESVFTTYAKFHTLLPGNVGDIPDSERGLVTAQAAACFWTFEGAYFESKRGVRFVDRKHGKPMFLDLWNNNNITNRSFVVFGAPGSGKTFMLLNLIDQWLSLGYQVVVVDKVGNYKLLAEAYGQQATFIECSEQHPLQFNPFIVSKDEEGNWKPTTTGDGTDEIDLIVKTLFTALRLGSDGATVIEERALRKLLEAFFKKIEKQSEPPTFDQFYEYLEALTDSEKKQLVRGQFEFDEFSVGMDAFRTGKAFGKILNGTSNQDIMERPFVVFDNKLVDDSDTLKVLMTYVSGLIIAHKLMHRADKNQPLVVLFDEAWSNLGSKMGAYLIEFLYRCCRRYWGAVGIITQSIADVEKSSLQHIISANASTMFSFKPTEKERSMYKLLMSLTDHQLDLLYSITPDKNRREVFLKTAETAAVYGIETSTFTRLLLSSWAPDQARIQHHLTQSGNVEQAVLSVLQERCLGE